MAHTYFIEHKGTRIVYLDFANVQETEEALRRIAEARQFITQQPPNSARTLTHVAGSAFNPRIVRAITALAEADKPYVRHGAVVGLSGLMTVIHNTIVRITGRNLQAFDDLEAAKDWLAEQQ